jgi:hypothetical protein
MELNKKQKCEKLIGRWKYLDEKFPKVQSIKPGEKFEINSDITSKEREERGEIMENIRDNCMEFLSPADRYKIHKRTRRN